MLQAHSAVAEHRHRLAFRLEISVSHGHRRFFVAAGQELRHLIAAVVDDRLVNAAEARAWVRGDVLDVQRLEYVHHEVAPRTISGERFDLDCRVGFARRRRCGRWSLCRGTWRGGRLCGSGN